MPGGAFSGASSERRSLGKPLTSAEVPWGCLCLDERFPSKGATKPASLPGGENKPRREAGLQAQAGAVPFQRLNPNPECQQWETLPGAAGSPTARAKLGAGSLGELAKGKRGPGLVLFGLILGLFDGIPK